MPKFNVGITVNAPISTIVEVEAETEDEAEEMARNIVLNDNSYGIKDFDGNYIDVLDSDLTTDSIDRGA